MIFLKSFSGFASLQFLLSLIFLPLLVVFSLVNTEALYSMEVSFVYFAILILYSVFSLLGILFFSKNPLKNSHLNTELVYLCRSIFLSLLFFLPTLWIGHFFLSNHLGEANLYLRVYGKIAFIFLALALCISPVLHFVKRESLREWIFLSRKIFGILSFIFFLKHGLEYFSAEYLYQAQYHSEMSYVNYTIQNIFSRNDALSGVVAGVLMFVLGITSNKISLKIFSGKVWKMIQSLIYPAFILSLIHIAFASRFDLFYMILGVVVVALRTIVYLLKQDQVSSGVSTKYLCVPCGYIYDESLGDPDGGIAPGTKFEDIPDNWVCPVCGVGKADFIAYYDGTNNSSSLQQYTANITSYTLLTQDVLELTISLSQKLDIAVGQYIRIILKDFDGTFSRAYSVAKYKDEVVLFG